jgi:hypothetical protein
MNPDREPFDVTDPTLDALLRAHSEETPSPDIDAAILGAAHRAVQSSPRDAAKPAEATSPWRWWMPITAAAVIGAIAIGVLQLIPKEPESTATVVSDTPANAPTIAPKPTAPPPPVVAKREAPTEAKRAASPEPFSAQRRDEAPRRTEKRLAAPPAAAEQRAPAAPAPEQAASAGAIAKQSGAALDTQVENPDQRIARIRALFSEGKLDEAARELNAFRAVHLDADERLPAELRAWAATVKR